MRAIDRRTPSDAPRPGIDGPVGLTRDRIVLGSRMGGGALDWLKTRLPVPETEKQAETDLAGLPTILVIGAGREGCSAQAVDFVYLGLIRQT